MKSSEPGKANLHLKKAFQEPRVLEFVRLRLPTVRILEESKLRWLSRSRKNDVPNLNSDEATEAVGTRDSFEFLKCFYSTLFLRS